MRCALRLVALAAVIAAGCETDFGAADQPAALSETSLGVSFASREALDVAWVRFDISEVSCADQAAGPPTYIGGVTKPIEGVTLPGGLVTLEGAPFDAGSTHFFADHYFSLDPGCYLVEAVALDDDKQPLADCLPGRRDRVEVISGKTVEVVLVIQCEGPADGALDEVTGVNRAPLLTAFDYQPAKYLDLCAPSVTVCATARDVDDDPLEFVWAHQSGPLSASGPTPVSSELLANGSLKRCVHYTFSSVGAHRFSVSVFDLVGDGAGGLIRVETYLANQGTPQPSRDVLEFPVFVAACEAEAAPPLPAGGCVESTGVCYPIEVPPPGICRPDSPCRPADLLPPPPTCLTDACRPVVYGPLLP